MKTRHLPLVSVYTAHGPSPSPLSPERIVALEQIEIGVWNTLHRLATHEEAATSGLHARRVGSATMLTASQIDVLAFNRVIGLGMDTPVSEALLDEVIARYETARVPRFFIQVSPASMPPALFEWLRARGFVHHNNWVKLYRGVAPPPPVTTPLRIEQVGPAWAETFGLITAPAFDWPPVAQKMLARLVGRPGWRHYMAFDGSTPVAAAGLYVSGTTGYFGPAATLPAYRGWGAQSALIARRIRDAAALGCTMLTTETAEDRPDRSAPSFRNMRRFGFEIAYLRPNYLLRLPRPGDVKVA